LGRSARVAWLCDAGGDDGRIAREFERGGRVVAGSRFARGPAKRRRSDSGTSGVKQVPGREFARKIQARGWALARVKGSHHIFTKPGHRERIVIPIHGNQPLKIGLLKSLMSDCGADGGRTLSAREATRSVSVDPHAEAEGFGTQLSRPKLTFVEGGKALWHVKYPVRPLRWPVSMEFSENCFDSPAHSATFRTPASLLDVGLNP